MKNINYKKATLEIIDFLYHYNSDFSLIWDKLTSNEDVFIENNIQNILKNRLNNG